jgi:hypothetical protein
MYFVLAMLCRRIGLSKEMQIRSALIWAPTFL